MTSDILADISEYNKIKIDAARYILHRNLIKLDLIQNNLSDRLCFGNYFLIKNNTIIEFYCYGVSNDMYCININYPDIKLLACADNLIKKDEFLHNSRETIINLVTGLLKIGFIIYQKSNI